MSGSLAYGQVKQLSLLHVGNKTSDQRLPTRFGWYILEHMPAAGFRRPADLAKAMGLPRSTMSRWIFDSIRPNTDSLRLLATALNRDYGEVTAAAGHGEVGKGASLRSLAPLAMELDQMIGDGSPLDEADQQYLRDMVDRLISQYRRKVRRRPA